MTVLPADVWAATRTESPIAQTVSIVIALHNLDTQCENRLFVAIRALMCHFNNYACPGLSQNFHMLTSFQTIDRCALKGVQSKGKFLGCWPRPCWGWLGVVGLPIFWPCHCVRACFAIDFDEIAASFGNVLGHIPQLDLLAGTSDIAAVVSSSLVAAIINHHD
jgi:hypothetical protein